MYVKFSKVFQLLIKENKTKQNKPKWYGRGIILRIKMEQNDEVCFGVQSRGKSKNFAFAASATIKRTITQMDSTLQNVACNSICQFNHTVSR